MPEMPVMSTISVRAGIAALLLAAFMASPAAAADNVLLIQTLPGGAYKIWHNEGESKLSEDDVMALEATARPGGGDEMRSSAGPARAYETRDGVTIRLLAASNDQEVLVDRDSCGHIRLWHSAGPTRLSDDDLTDIVISALPEGGKRLTIGPYYVKAYMTRLGVTAALWSAPAK